MRVLKQVNRCRRRKLEGLNERGGTARAHPDRLKLWRVCFVSPTPYACQPDCLIFFLLPNPAIISKHTSQHPARTVTCYLLSEHNDLHASTLAQSKLLTHDARHGAATQCTKWHSGETSTRRREGRQTGRIASKAPSSAPSNIPSETQEPFLDKANCLHSDALLAQEHRGSYQEEHRSDSSSRCTSHHSSRSCSISSSHPHSCGSRSSHTHHILCHKSYSGQASTRQ